MVSVAALGLAFAPAAAASAEAAVITPFHYQSTETFVSSPAECITDPKTGVETDYFTTDGQTVQNSAGISVHGTDRIAGTVIYDDGSYIDIAGQSRFEYSSHNSTSAFTTSGGTEKHFVHAADGSLIATAVFHYVDHVTMNVSTGSVKSSFERFFISCVG